ncbi:ABC transporter substrate-binding protein [Lentzea flaviverrucosa]|uniref:ABC transporter substrate-binding protein n=1 Tax=Lentzea flaviverrucosa TaxID=200379 RepID=UPI001B871E90|nr:ABC transporter substrate-binding protein [Lentzea flaviverrucosa]
MAGNNLPDITMFPSPGNLLDIAELGGMVPLDGMLDLPALKSTLVPGLMEATENAEGKTFGVPIRMAVKSVVWTAKPQFQAAGYTVPTDAAGLRALTEKIKSTGVTPWCLGMESGPATGWVATDWIEEYVLRIGGPEVYDQWVTHKIPFNSPVVKQAAEAFAEIAFPKGNVLGGREAITSTPFGTAGNSMFDSKPGCYLMRQGNFIASGDFFPKNITSSLDTSTTTFQLPPTDPSGPAGANPVLLGGDLAAAFKGDDPDVKAVMEFLSSDKFGAEWAKIGGWLSPHKTFDASNYPDQTTRDIAKIAVNATSSVFDGSDRMPAAVGSGSFWRGMTAWVSGQKDLDTVLNEIEASWPEK